MIVLTGAVPLEMIWGGRLKNEQERVVMPPVSMVVHALMVALVPAPWRECGDQRHRGEGLTLPHARTRQEGISKLFFGSEREGFRDQMRRENRA